MHILVLNGSPKGDYSITLQTVRYLEILHPEHTFEVQNVGQRIRVLEQDFSAMKASLEKADLLLFSYPVYTFIVPYQLQRFIELAKASGVNLKGKAATQISTSKHFYDITAHRYIQENCADFDLHYIHGLSADMEDLTTEEGRQQAEAFFQYVMWSMEHANYEPVFICKATPVHMPVTVPEASEKNKSGDVVIVTDCTADNTQLQNMIDRFRAVLPRKTRIVNITDYPFQGGCLGCFNCAISGKCIYKDGFDDYLRNEIQIAQSIVYAFTVKDHSMGARFKLYDDRNFCNGHRTVTIGMPIGYLVSGTYSAESNLQNIIEARAQVGSNFMAGVATDEVNPDAEIDRLAENLEYALQNCYVPPQNFYGIGGMKVFRDLIWLMQGMMRADHKFYKEHGQYDFPQKKWPDMLKMYLVGELLANPKLKAKAGGKMSEGMIAPYKKVLDKARKQVKKQNRNPFFRIGKQK
ncbi:MAG: NAD(P)H-dependent oxidoreductase [Peptococcaceae bacterium]|jgi:multimeric flavodoxin WrbA|nr:NAD(P)H-dependent oxidoreductase [Peptococcaceae bacterium]